MSKTHQQIWIISFKSIFLKSYIDISCILLPVDSPHLGFFLVFCWAWRSKSGVNLQNHTFCALTFIDNSVQTIYTYICHPLSPQCGQYQLQMWPTCAQRQWHVVQCHVQDAVIQKSTWRSLNATFVVTFIQICERMIMRMRMRRNRERCFNYRLL